MVIGDPNFPNQISFSDRRSCPKYSGGFYGIRFGPREEGFQIVASPYFRFENWGELKRAIEFRHGQSMLGEKILQPSQAFIDPLQGGGVGNAHVVFGSESLPGDHNHAGFFQEFF